jgi:hypothetical protein
MRGFVGAAVRRVDPRTVRQWTCWRTMSKAIETIGPNTVFRIQDHQLNQHVEREVPPMGSLRPSLISESCRVHKNFRTQESLLSQSKIYSKLGGGHTCWHWTQSNQHRKRMLPTVLKSPDTECGAVWRTPKVAPQTKDKSKLLVE